MTSIGDFADRPPRAFADGETLSLGRHAVRWFDTPHLPHSWDCGHLFEETTRTLLCGDLFTQPGSKHPPITEGDIFDRSEAFRRALDYYAHAANTGEMLEVERKDRLRIDSLNSGDTDAFWAQVQEGHDPLKWCGSAPFYTFLRALPAARGHLLDYEHWQIDPESVVTYGAMRFI